MWDLPRPGLEPVSPALAGRFSTTAPPGQPPFSSFKIFLFTIFYGKTRILQPHIPMTFYFLPMRFFLIFSYLLFLMVDCVYFLFIYLFIYLFLAVLGLRFCARAFSSCGKRGPLFIAVCGPLTVAASLVAEHRLQTHRLSNCGSRA